MARGLEVGQHDLARVEVEVFVRVEQALEDDVARFLRCEQRRPVARVVARAALAFRADAIDALRAHRRLLVEERGALRGRLRGAVVVWLEEVVGLEVMMLELLVVL